MIGRALASLGLFGLAGLMVYYKVDPCCLGLIIVLSLGCIWDYDNKKDTNDN